VTQDGVASRLDQNLFIKHFLKQYQAIVLKSLSVKKISNAILTTLFHILPPVLSEKKFNPAIKFSVNITAVQKA